MFSSFERQRKACLAGLAASALLLSGLPALAQQTPQQTTPATTPAPATAPAPAAAPKAAAEPSASHLAAARELVVVSGMSRSFNAAVPELMTKLSETLTQSRPELASDLTAVLKDIRPEFSKDIDQMTDKAAHIYASLLSEQQINAAIAFFTSDAGKKYVQAEPVFFNEVINAMQDWHQQISAELVTRVRAEMKKKGHTL